ncbi:MAG: hypothetical protein IH589_10675 [Anaerolineales bacterium]|nr:hypothetical protein [Anaerolineales bacterium]
MQSIWLVVEVIFWYLMSALLSAVLEINRLNVGEKILRSQYGKFIDTR